MTDLMTLIFGSYTPPNVPGRVVSHDDAPPPTVKARFKEFGRRASKRAVDRGTGNAERIKIHLMANPWSTANEIGEALGLTKSPVYKHLMCFKGDAKVEVRSKRVGGYTIVTYKWATGK